MAWNSTRIGSSISLSSLNQTASCRTLGFSQCAFGDTEKSVGRLYLEFVANASNGDGAPIVGVASASCPTENASLLAAYQRTYYGWNGKKYPANIAYGQTWVAAVIGLAADFYEGSLAFSVDNVWQGVSFNDLLSMGAVCPVFIGDQSSATLAVTLKTTAASFTYAPPAGYTAWDTPGSQPTPISFF